MFNRNQRGLNGTRGQENLGLSPGRRCMELAKRKNLLTVIRRREKSAATFQNYRKTVKMAKLRAEESKKKQEGTACGSGEF